MNSIPGRTQTATGLTFLLLLLAGPEIAPASPQIHVDWGLPGAPVQGQDYVIDSSDPDFPDIELVTGDTTWRVWSRDSKTRAISDIGDITAYGEADYTLVLTDNYGNPGARHVQSITLTPAGTHDSGIDPYDTFTPSRVTGNLTGNLTLLNEGAGVGGYCSLTVTGDVSGIWSAPGPATVLIEGNVTSSADLTFGIINPARSIEIEGNVDGTIEITQGMSGAIGQTSSFIIGGNLNADVTMGQVQDWVEIEIGGDCNATLTTNYYLPPSLAFGSHSSMTVMGELGSNGVLDFQWHGVEGQIVVAHGGAGRIDGILYLAAPASVASIEIGTSPADEFSGHLIVSSLSYAMTGSIQITNLGSGADIYLSTISTMGTLEIAGDHAALATIEVGSNLWGTLHVGGGTSGTILVNDSLSTTGIMQFDNAMAGTIVIDEDADEVGEWLGDIYVYENQLVDPGCYWNDATIGGGSVVTGPQLAEDCNENGVPDACDIGYGDSADCNSDDVPDECLLMDWDEDADIDLVDFVNFQLCFQETSQDCRDAFDRALACDDIDLNDYEVLSWQLTGPDPGGRGAPTPPRSGGGRSSTPAPSPAPWQYEEAPIGLEVQPVGGGAPVTVLRPGTSYEVHYQADYVGVHGYVLFAVGTSPEVGFTEVRPADDGSWAETSAFRSYDLMKDLGVVMPAFGFPEGYYRYDLVSDSGPGLPEGQLCTFTTGSCGELHLHLYAWWIDESALFLAGMETQAGFIVAEE